MKLLDICIKKAPEILTGINVVGVGLTAWLTHRATKRAEEDLEEKPKWKYYILPGVSGAVTIAAGIGSNRISAKRLGEAIAIGALYADRVKALEGWLGKDEANYAKDDMARAKLADISDETFRDEKLLWFESETKQWFEATYQQVLMAEITGNKMFQSHKKLSINEWVSLLPGCKPKREWGDRWGWRMLTETDRDNWSNYQGPPWIDIQTKIGERNGRPYLKLVYGFQPMEFGDNQVMFSQSGLLE